MEIVATVGQDGLVELTVVITNTSDQPITGISAAVNPAQGAPDAVRHDVGTLAAGESVTIAPSVQAPTGPESTPARVVVTVTADGLLPVHAIALVRPRDPDTTLPPQLQPAIDPPAVVPVPGPAVVHGESAAHGKPAAGQQHGQSDARGAGRR